MDTMTIQHSVKRVLACLLLASLVVASGCKSKKPVSITDTDATDGSGSGLGDGTGLGEGDTSVGVGGLPDLPPGTQFGSTSSLLQTVYFDYNSESLRSDAAATLENNAGLILNGTVKGYVQIAGHCDERGPQEYNLALGERRALTVREYLMRLGVPGDRLVTMSYGEESPAASGSGEEAWSQNRRCEFHTQVQ
jgi:peptidoglycan-associated lipoprotein